MDINGSTRLFFLLGDPIAQVQAPTLYNRLFHRHGVNAAVVPVHVSPQDLAAFAPSALKASNVGGLLLTIPHKSALMSLLTQVDRGGAMADSVNAIRRLEGGGLAGAQFDGVGLVGALRHFGHDPRGRRCLLVGAGGAGAAIAAALLDAAPAALAVRDLGVRAAQLVRRLADPRASVHDGSLAGYDIVIHATPLGLNRSDPLPIAVDELDRHAVVVDILMKPYDTPLIEACNRRGIVAYTGFEMLVQQVPSYLRFFGFTLLADEVGQDLREVRQFVAGTHP
jgi:shikimate dehydrogenase